MVGDTPPCTSEQGDEVLFTTGHSSPSIKVFYMAAFAGSLVRGFRESEVLCHCSLAVSCWSLGCSLIRAFTSLCHCCLHARCSLFFAVSEVLRAIASSLLVRLRSFCLCYIHELHVHWFVIWKLSTRAMNYVIRTVPEWQAHEIHGKLASCWVRCS